MSIQIPYKNSAVDSDLKNGTDWTSKDAKYLKIRKKLKDYLCDINSQCCFFCKSKINTGNSNGTIEHILSKSEYSMFTYKPENLTYSCIRCNLLKSASKVLTDEEIKKKMNYTYNTYPFESKSFKIIHPYLDDYDKCITLDDIFYKGIDSEGKGSNTIKLYNLNRLELAENKIKTEPSAFINQFLHLISNGYNLSEEEIESHIDFIFDNIKDNAINISHRPITFIEKFLNTNKKNNAKLISAINILDLNKVDIFKHYRIMIDELESSKQYDYIKIINSTFYNLEEETKLINITEEVLKTISALTRSSERCEELELINISHMFMMITKFDKYSNNEELKIKVSILNKLAYLCMCIGFYNKNENQNVIKSEPNTKRLKEKIKKDKEYLKILKQELKNARRVAQ
ncbi:hypothetical protein FDC45_11060 [Clostridium botulinum]|uniref:HNH endonuclease n=1 Tax=Clostridium botulinum TaxID=1491 RepID=A0A846J6H1_CLOBO|nr:hypothetical protein [Clostridium botulinum]ACA57504.1 hypothetical protein CLK_A0129 [Clostridium botulinum A3 str. Loch Maree]NFH65037.1 hypothetical protein [Clostridium botulinum]NFJ09509.1 hypothetical protein [Clostridium botulinum]NFK16669.1 hypothetical protein [Clostridium botulinum]NFM93443.1 hypothetical protein [Clostridium botulinum]